MYKYKIVFKWVAQVYDDQQQHKQLACLDLSLHIQHYSIAAPCRRTRVKLLSALSTRHLLSSVNARNITHSCRTVHNPRMAQFCTNILLHDRSDKLRRHSLNRLEYFFDYANYMV